MQIIEGQVNNIMGYIWATHIQGYTKLYSIGDQEREREGGRGRERILYLYKIQKHFQNVMMVGMASENSKNYIYKCVDRSRHNGICLGVCVCVCGGGGGGGRGVTLGHLAL